MCCSLFIQHVLILNLSCSQIARNLVPQQQTCQVWIRSDEQFSRYVQYNHTDTQTDCPCFIVSCLEQSELWTATTEYLEGSTSLKILGVTHLSIEDLCLKVKTFRSISVPLIRPSASLPLRTPHTNNSLHLLPWTAVQALAKVCMLAVSPDDPTIVNTLHPNTVCTSLTSTAWVRLWQSCLRWHAL